MARQVSEADEGWWNVTTTRGRYTVYAKDDIDAEDIVWEDVGSDEPILDGMTSGPYATREAAEDA